MKIKILISFFIIMSSFLAPLALSPKVEAVSGDCYFKKGDPVESSSGCGEDGLGDYGTNDVLTGRSTSGKGWAIDPDKVNTKAKFIDFIIDRYHGGDHNKIGASYLIQKMRGEKRLASLPSGSEVQDWKNRVNASDVTIKFYQKRTVGATTWYDNDKKNIFLGAHPDVSRRVIEIYQRGDLRAVIEMECGNMTAQDDPLSSPWDVDPNTTINTPTVSPGEPVIWTHTYTNKGPGSMTTGGTYKINTSPSGTSSGGSANYGAHEKGWKVTITRSYVAKASDLGKNLCQSITIDPNSSTNSSSETSAQKCARVVGDYNLTPGVDLTVSGVVDPGSLTTVTGTVEKDGSSNTPSQWELSKVIIAPGKPVPAAGDSTSTPQAYFENGGNNWTSQGVGTATFTQQLTEVIKLNNVEIDELPVGTRICWALSIKPPNNDFGGWRHSTPVCVTIGKKPKLQITGGDARIRGDAVTSTSLINSGTPKQPTLFGSWVEFGVFSQGKNSGLASGAGTRNGSIQPDQSQWSKLTFSNVIPNPLEDGQDAYKYGNFGAGLPSAPEISEYFGSQGSPIGSSINLSDPGLAAGVYRSTGSELQVTGGAGSINKTLVIISTGTVKITGNINYASTGLTSINSIPQVVIIASNIEIDGGVTNIDSWLIASGSINTCLGIPTTNPALHSGVCGNPLTINGPVATNKLYLYRTAGSNPGGAGDPAERFNLRPDAYLWAYNYGLKTTQPITSSVIELPPRF